MDVDVLARRDVLAGEADDLAVLVDRLALLDSQQSDLVAQADALRQAQRVAVVLKLGPGRQETRGDGDVVLRSQMDGDLGKRHGWHEAISTANGGVACVTIQTHSAIAKG